MAYPVPDDDAERLEALAAYNVVGTPPEMDFDEIATLAAQICGCAVGVVNLVADKWEWYKGRCGIPAHFDREPRGGVCSWTVCGTDLLIVPDLTRDERFAELDMVKGRPYLRFYAGVPLINPDGYALGTLCVVDHEPREIDARQMEALRCLSRQAVAQLELRRKVAELDHMRHALAAEKTRSEDLLRDILPEDIAEELKAEGRVRPRYYDSVTILFTDFKGFTRLTEQLEPRALIEELDEHFSVFDDIVARHGLEKLKTIGDAYMCVAGLPERMQDHATAACAAALEIRDYMARVNDARDKFQQPRWEIRIGLHTGGVIAGVVGKKKLTYDIWGDAVNVAALMEAHAEPGQIALSDSTFEQARSAFDTAFLNEIDTAKKGRIRYHVLKGRI